ncbi:hypothetical protein [Streptomyces sp. NBC_00162]|uniref:hypothetical protein n=1 Tax=Streptomyces sp. NBC_00162 TaxID=2903629 RepID=UPI00214B5543|nr:hypothetical protein [Streptomyces sp. NBC_00162]UUU42678.1 hypothetical protein JIW86_29980 [Streptomyces sp. NBC_00162]
MSAPTHTRSLPSGPRAASAARAVPGARALPGARQGAEARLHWWALALPALAFGLLLLLLAGSGEAHAATGEATGLLQVTQQLLRAVG